MAAAIRSRCCRISGGKLIAGASQRQRRIVEAMEIRGSVCVGFGIFVTVKIYEPIARRPCGCGVIGNIPARGMNSGGQLEHSMPPHSIQDAQIHWINSARSVGAFKAFQCASRSSNKGLHSLRVRVENMGTLRLHIPGAFGQSRRPNSSSDIPNLSRIRQRIRHFARDVP